MFTDAFAAMFDSSELDPLAKCNQFGRFPILPLSTLEPTIADGNFSDDSCSPTTPLDAYNLSLHTLAYQKVDPFASQYSQCLPMSALYISPPQLPSDVESASTTDSSSPDSEHVILPTSTTPTFPSQAPSSSKKRASPSDASASDEAPSAAKKPRVSVGRIRAKDFIPPDVSGMCKREARLVKNRAAAFLSRQRKREEFEAMEIRLAELEQENADLRRATSGESGACPSSPSTSSFEPMELQLSSMRQLLRAAEEREASVKNELEQLQLESNASGSSSHAPKANNRASLGLMAVLSLSSVLQDAQDSSWARGLAVGDSVAFCDGETGAPEIEVSCTPSTDGKMRVRLHRPSEQLKQEDAQWPFDSPSSLGFMDDVNDAFSLLPKAPKRMRIALASATLNADGADLEVEIR